MNTPTRSNTNDPSLNWNALSDYSVVATTDCNSDDAKKTELKSTVIPVCDPPCVILIRSDGSHNALELFPGSIVTFKREKTKGGEFTNNISRRKHGTLSSSLLLSNSSKDSMCINMKEILHPGSSSTIQNGDCFSILDVDNGRLMYTLQNSHAVVDLVVATDAVQQLKMGIPKTVACESVLNEKNVQFTFTYVQEVPACVRVDALDADTLNLNLHRKTSSRVEAMQRSFFIREGDAILPQSDGGITSLNSNFSISIQPKQKRTNKRHNGNLTHQKQKKSKVDVSKSKDPFRGDNFERNVIVSIVEPKQQNILQAKSLFPK